MTETVITREMGLTHKEFFRTLPKVLDGQRYQIADSMITVAEPPRRLTIHLGPEGERRIAMLRLPTTAVSLRFVDYTEAEIDEFMTRFGRYYQRGGG